jgi:hypothetical protein
MPVACPSRIIGKGNKERCVPLPEPMLAKLRPLWSTHVMKTPAEAIIELARDRRYVGGTVAVMAVLHINWNDWSRLIGIAGRHQPCAHTWTPQLVYHPHADCLVTGGGVSDDDRFDTHYYISSAPLDIERIAAAIGTSKACIGCSMSSSNKNER